MKIAIVGSLHEEVSNKIADCFCGRYVPYNIQKSEAFRDGKHVGIFFLDEKNPELVNKIINLIKDESRENLG